ncbi:CpcT/CpeT family chromophore lyase [Nostoc sp.]
MDAKDFFRLDRGKDLDTDVRLWGSITGPFHFARWGLPMK